MKLKRIRIEIIAEKKDVEGSLDAYSHLPRGSCIDWLERYGAAVIYGKEYLGHIFDVDSNGRLIRVSGICEDEVIIDIFDSANSSWLAKLHHIRHMLALGASCALSIPDYKSKEEAYNFDVHGHLPDGMPVRIAMDEHGSFYLPDIRRAFENSKIKLPGQKILESAEF